MDVYELAIFNYVRVRNGQTILMKDVCSDLNISDKTVKKKISSLIDKNFLKRDGKKFFVLKEV